MSAELFGPIYEVSVEIEHKKVWLEKAKCEQCQSVSIELFTMRIDVRQSTRKRSCSVDNRAPKARENF